MVIALDARNLEFPQESDPFDNEGAQSLVEAEIDYELRIILVFI